MAGGEHLSAVETIMWLVEQDPVLSSTFGSVTLLDRPPDHDRLRRRFARMAAATPRLRRRVATSPVPLTPPTWRDDPDFDLDHHVRRVALPPPGDRQALLDLACRFVQDPFDRQRPLWQYLVVEGVEGGRAALVQKMHHAVTDGVGGVRLSEQFVDLTRDAAEPGPLPEEPADPAGAGGDPRGPWEALTAPWEALAAPAQHLAGLVGRAAGEVARDLARPVRVAALPGELAAAARSTARQLVVTDPAHSPLWTTRSPRRQLRAFDADLDDARRAAKALGGSLNDLFVAAAAGGAGAYHRHHGVNVADLRVTVPVSTRRDRSAGGNAFVPARVLVPAGTADPRARFTAVHETLAALKREPVLGLADALAGVAVMVPAPLLARAARRQVETIDFATSNVRAAPFDLFVAGARIEGNYAVGPLGGTAFNLTMMSYCGTLNLGLNVDAGAVRDPALLEHCLVGAFTELVEAGR